MVELRVAEGSSVGIRIGVDGSEEEWTVARSGEEADWRRGRMSAEAPLAMALIGHGPGETVTVHGPRTYRATILTVR